MLTQVDNIELNPLLRGFTPDMYDTPGILALGEFARTAAMCFVAMLDCGMDARVRAIERGTK